MEEKGANSATQIDPMVWLNQHGDVLYRYALSRVHDPDVAEDLVQDTFVSGIKSFASFDGRSTLRTWLVSILRRRISDQLARESRRQQHRSREDYATIEANLLNPVISEKQFASEIERDEFVHFVQRCLSTLPDHLREAMAVRLEQDECSLKEICEQLGITSENLAVRLYRARLLLRACLEQTWLKG